MGRWSPVLTLSDAEVIFDILKGAQAFRVALRIGSSGRGDRAAPGAGTQGA
jgi:hypothetical protein